NDLMPARYAPALKVRIREVPDLARSGSGRRRRLGAYAEAHGTEHGRGRPRHGRGTRNRQGDRAAPGPGRLCGGGQRYRRFVGRGGRRDRTGRRCGVGKACCGVEASDIDDSSAGVVAEIEQAGGVAAAKTADVADADQVAALLQFTLERFGRLDAAVNNAGVGAMPKRLAVVSLAEWQRAIDVTLTGTFLSMHAELAHFDAQGAGVVVNIASIASLMANPQLTPYGASKHGVASLTTSAAVEYAPRGIRINAVAPGPIQTDALASLPEKERAEYAAKVPAQRLGKPEEIAAATSWLLSDQAGFVSGVILPVDGGAQHVP